MDINVNKNKIDDQQNFDDERDFDLSDLTSKQESYKADLLLKQRIFNLDKKQKIMLAILSAVVFISVVAGFWRIKNILMLEYGVNPGDKPQSEIEQTVKNNSDLSDVDVEDLKKRDTDNDGLTDFEEIYIYETSAYLADSDSDGDDDLAEIKVGQDPTCAKGVNCFSGAQEESTIQEEGLAADPLLNITAENLRILLVKSKQIKEADLVSIPDDELLTMFHQMINDNSDLAEQLRIVLVQQMNNAKMEQQDFATAENQPEVTDLQNLSIEQIKKNLLANTDLTEADLAKVDDEALRQLYLEALAQVKAKKDE